MAGQAERPSSQQPTTNTRFKKEKKKQNSKYNKLSPRIVTISRLAAAAGAAAAAGLAKWRNDEAYIYI